MASDLRVEMLPARQGDCVLLQWSDGDRRRRMLIDAGPARAYDAIAQRLRALDDPHLDLLVLTHVDADHVEGTILLVNDRGLGLSIDDVWYNGSKQLSDELSPVQGEMLGMLIHDRNLSWNKCFGGKAVRAPDAGDLLTRDLPGGLRITVLAPDAGSLRRLHDNWSAACQEANFAVGSVADALAALRARPKLSPLDAYLGGEPVPNVGQLARNRIGTDTSVTNASSIVLLIEHGDVRILLAGDATPAALTLATDRLLAQRGVDKLPLAAFKLPHHGSAKNLDAGLVRKWPAEHYLFSADGSHSKHPDDAAVATVLEHGPVGTELVFNYDTPGNRRWEDPDLLKSYRYRVRFPDHAGRVELILPGGAE